MLGRCEFNALDQPMARIEKSMLCSRHHIVLTQMTEGTEAKIFCLPRIISTVAALEYAPAGTSQWNFGQVIHNVC